jgi:hypothetical protein
LKLGQIASYIVSYAVTPPSASAGSEKTYPSFGGAVKGEHPVKGFLRWVILYVTTTAAIVIIGLVSSATSTPSYDESGAPTASFTSGSTITWYAGVLLLFIGLGIAVRTQQFADVQHENPKLGIVFTLVKVAAKRRFLLAIVISVAFVFDWGTLFTLIIFAVVLAVFYLVDRNKVGATASPLVAVPSPISTGNIDADVAIQIRGGAPFGYMFVTTFHPDEFKNRGLVDGEWAKCDANGIHVFKPKAAEAFVQSPKNVG